MTDKEQRGEVDKPILNLSYHKTDCVYYSNEHSASDNPDYYAGQGDYHTWNDCLIRKMVQVPGTEGREYRIEQCPMYCKSHCPATCWLCGEKLTPEFISSANLAQGWEACYKIKCLTVGCQNWDKEILRRVDG